MRRHSRSGPRLTSQKAALIKGLWNHTNLNQAQIASKLGGINQGRVSEVVRGLRFENIAPASEDVINGL